MERQDQVAALERIVMGAVGLTTRSLASAAPSIDLTFPQWRALVILGELEEGARIGAIASRVGVTLPATGRLLRRLERRGIVALATDEDDRRATRARLTQQGLEARAAIIDYRRRVLADIAVGLGAAEAGSVDLVIERLADAFGPFA